MDIKKVETKIAALTENDLNAFFESLTPEEMTVLVKILVQSLASGKADWSIPGMAELKAGIITQYGSFRRFAQLFPVLPTDVKAINSIFGKLSQLRGLHGS